MDESDRNHPDKKNNNNTKKKKRNTGGGAPACAEAHFERLWEDVEFPRYYPSSRSSN